MYGAADHRPEPADLVRWLEWCRDHMARPQPPPDLYPLAMGRALVLNASYEPLGVVASRRAVVLVLGGQGRHACTTPGGCLHCERVASRCRRSSASATSSRCRTSGASTCPAGPCCFRDGSRCQYCGRDADSIDHVVPRSRGGTHAWDNVVAACRRCNLAKGNRLLGEISMTLRRLPMAPKQLRGCAVTVERVPEQWKPYLGEQLLSA